MIPVLGDKKFTTIPQTTTTDTKYGSKVAIWVNLLTNLFFISVTATANKIGTGKHTTICQKEIIMVFLNTLAKSRPVKKSMKFLNPTNLLPANPLKIL